MLPIFVRDDHNRLCIKPVLQVIFEDLHAAGFQEYYFITGRGKRAIEDYFSIDKELLEYNKSRNNLRCADELSGFYKKIKQSSIVFVNQAEPKGFGDAVYQAKASTKDEPFLVHAGDDLIISANGPGNKSNTIARLIHVFETKNAAAVFCVERAKDPRKYGVIAGEKVDDNVYRVTDVVEKPVVPLSNLAIVAVYVFGPVIYSALEKTVPDAKGELQLTTAIRFLIENGYPVYAVQIDDDERRIDIGSPGTYLMALKALSRRPMLKQPLPLPPVSTVNPIIKPKPELGLS
jgi:UTP--glucose-1-phosphate uridylyltransferase